MQKDATNIEAARLEEADVAPEEINKAIDEDGAPLATAEPKKRPGRPRAKKSESGEKNENSPTPEKEAVKVSESAPKKRTATKKTTKKTEKTEPVEPTEAIEKAEDVKATETAEAAETAEVTGTAEAVEDITPEITDSDKPSEDGTPSVEDMPSVTEPLCTEEHAATPLMNVEHFSDYRSKDAESSEELEEDSVPSPIVIPVSENEDELPEDVVEYENLTILDDEPEPTEEMSESEETLPEKESVPETKWTKTRWDEVKYDPEKPRRVDARFELLELFVFTLAVIMLLSTFIFRHSVVEGGSMEGTLHDGEYLVISDLFYTPKRGDIIVCADYTTGLEKPIVKRVIAVGGETVSITRDGEIYVDGELLVEDYVFIDEEGYTYRPMLYTVPEGEVFVMGDHRNKSTDSRVFGTVKEDAILGRVLIRFLPLEKFGKVK